MFERIENDITVQLFGNAFLSELVTSKCVIVDGDLICRRVECPKLNVVHGSLICPDVKCREVSAEILGVFELGQAFEAPLGWSYTWLRPVVAMPRPEAWSSEESIVNATKALTAVVADAIVVQPLLDKILSRQNCGRARVLFAVALEELTEHPETLTPLGRQVVACLMQQSRLPDHWRY